jgi:hypothetical protein
VSATGGAVVRLNTNLPAGAEVQDFRMNTLNSNFVYYIADQYVLDRHEMFSVSITGGVPVQISPIVTGASSNASFRSYNGNGPIISYVFNDRSISPFILHLEVSINQITWVFRYQRELQVQITS